MMFEEASVVKEEGEPVSILQNVLAHVEEIIIQFQLNAAHDSVMENLEKMICEDYAASKGTGVLRVVPAMWCVALPPDLSRQ